ncbi:MAG: response regulator transcription factor [Caldilineaceae bacterium]|nr:response regulator transcription factor [Caldilineaceae bacterium]
MDTAGKRRVVLLSAQPLLSAGLAAILCGLDDVDLIGPWPLDRQALARLAEEAPDVVLVAEGETPDVLSVQILEHYPDLPVVRIGLSQNVVRLYSSRTIPAHSTALIETIRSLSIQHFGDAPA